MCEIIERNDFGSGFLLPVSDIFLLEDLPSAYQDLHSRHPWTSFILGMAPLLIVKSS